MILSARFEDTLIFAARLHAHQSRKGNDVPYVAHLLAVAAIVLENGGNEDEAIAALLHDAVEDQGGAKTREEIRRRFGDEVTTIVDGCTDTDVFPKPPWRQRKEQFLNSLPAASASVLLVTAADKLHNVRAILNDYRVIGEKVWSVFTGGREGTLWYYRALVDALKPVYASPLVDELERVVVELEKISMEKK
jgi:GTP pyrophosphokinase